MSSATLTAPAAPCRSCGCTERRIVDRTFKDGSEHNAEVCAQCGQHFRFVQRQRRPSRQLLPIAESPALTTTAPRTLPPANDTLNRALDALDSVHDRADQLRNELRNKPPDQAAAVAVLGAVVAAAANLSAENVAGLTDAIRQGKLPRKRSASVT
jgi:hypothetical protein